MKIALVGYGKMGKAIEEIALQKGHTIDLKINSTNTGDLNKHHLQNCDVAIEFTHPKVAPQNIIRCLEAGIPIVSGSTGWLADWENITQKCIELNGSFLYASNFSIGVNIFFELNTCLAKWMNEQQSYNVDIEEIHHTQKKDAPSGTAITLARQIIEHIDRKTTWVNRQQQSENELSITSKRVDPAPGTHIVNYRSEIDDITITHTAHSRKGFATGAVLAAEFLQNKKGIFSMKDVLAF